MSNKHIFNLKKNTMSRTNNRICIYLKPEHRAKCEQESMKMYGESNISGYLSYLVQKEKPIEY